MNQHNNDKSSRKIPSPAALVTNYVTDLQMNNWSLTTVSQRRRSLERFLRWSSQRSVESVTDITPEVASAYRRHLFHYRNEKTGKPIKFASQAAELSALKSWLAWLLKHGWIKTNPALDVQLPKAERRLPSGFLSQSEVEQLINSVNLKTPVGIRNRVILEIFYSTAMRRTELRNLSIDDIDTGRRIVMIRQGKGHKDRMVPIGQRALDWLEKYLTEVRPKFFHESRSGDTLILTNRGRPFSVGHLTHLVRKQLDSIGIKKRGSCHMIRHTTATLMMEGGADLRSLQTLLGHEQLNTTQVYTHMTINRLREVHDRTHPGATDKKPKPDNKKEKPSSDD